MPNYSILDNESVGSGPSSDDEGTLVNSYQRDDIESQGEIYSINSIL